MAATTGPAELARALEDPDLAAGLLVELGLVSDRRGREALEDTLTAIGPRRGL